MKFVWAAWVEVEAGWCCAHNIYRPFCFYILFYSFWIVLIIFLKINKNISVPLEHLLASEQVDYDSPHLVLLLWQREFRLNHICMICTPSLLFTILMVLKFYLLWNAMSEWTPYWWMCEEVRWILWGEEEKGIQMYFSLHCSLNAYFNVLYIYKWIMFWT